MVYEQPLRKSAFTAFIVVWTALGVPGLARHGRRNGRGTRRAEFEHRGTDDYRALKCDITRKSHLNRGWLVERCKGLAVARGDKMARLSLHPKAAIRDSCQASEACSSLTWV
jgi:hypothetical protein